MLTGALRHGRKHREAMERARMRVFGFDLGFYSQALWWTPEETQALKEQGHAPLQFNRTALDVCARSKVWQDMVAEVNRQPEPDNSTAKAIQVLIDNVHRRSTSAISMKYDQATGQVTAEPIDPYL